MTAKPAQIQVPPQLRAAAALGRTDYEDAFLLRLEEPPEWTASQWAEAVLERAPSRLREIVVAGWKAIRLDLASDEAILGWRIRSADPELTVLAAESPLGISARLVFERRREGLLYGTFVRLEGESGARAWARIAPAHPPIVGELLALAATRTGKGSHH